MTLEEVTDKKGRRYIGDVDDIIWNVTIEVAGLYHNTKRQWTV